MSFHIHIRVFTTRYDPMSTSAVVWRAFDRTCSWSNVVLVSLLVKQYTVRETIVDLDKKVSQRLDDVDEILVDGHDVLLLQTLRDECRFGSRCVSQLWFLDQFRG